MLPGLQRPQQQPVLPQDPGMAGAPIQPQQTPQQQLGGAQDILSLMKQQRDEAYQEQQARPKPKHRFLKALAGVFMGAENAQKYQELKLAKQQADQQEVANRGLLGMQAYEAAGRDKHQAADVAVRNRAIDVEEKQGDRRLGLQETEIQNEAQYKLAALEHERVELKLREAIANQDDKRIRELAQEENTLRERLTRFSENAATGRQKAGFEHDSGMLDRKIEADTASDNARYEFQGGQGDKDRGTQLALGRMSAGIEEPEPSFMIGGRKMTATEAIERGATVKNPQTQADHELNAAVERNKKLGVYYQNPGVTSGNPAVKVIPTGGMPMVLPGSLPGLGQK